MLAEQFDTTQAGIEVDPLLGWWNRPLYGCVDFEPEESVSLCGKMKHASSNAQRG